MECSVCRDLERAYAMRLRELIEARSSACYRVSEQVAAVKNVDMERARYELEEHRIVCAGKVLALHAERETSSTRWRQSAA